MKTYRLGSSPMIHTPGILAWAQNGYQFEEDRPQLLRIMTSAFPSVPPEALDLLLKCEVSHTVVDEVVEFSA